MNVLIVAMEATRWGPARLPRFLLTAGFGVDALCPSDNPLASTRYVQRRFDLPRTRFLPRFRAAFEAAMERSRASLVIPGDDLTLAILHALRERPGTLDAEAIEILARSLGARDNLDGLLFKNECQRVAAAAGVRTPDGGPANTFEDAERIATRVGYPVVLKQSFSWGGAGVAVCADAAELRDAFIRMAPREWLGLRRRARGLLGMDWYPQPHELWVQKKIEGDPAMYTVAAFAGRMVAGFAGVPLRTSTSTGPSTVVEFGPHAEMASFAETMTAALGANGFVSYDFMLERATGMAHLLECNARPNQVSHLGPRVGVDLCGALRDAMTGVPNKSAPAAAVSSETVTLFPQEWLRSPDSPAIVAHSHDVPWDDPGLVAHCVAAAGAPRRDTDDPMGSEARSILRGRPEPSRIST